MLGISPAQSRPNVTERVRVVPELMESEGAVGFQAEGLVVTPQRLSPLTPSVITVPNLPQSLSLGPTLPQTLSLPEILNVQSLSQLFFLIQSSPDELDPALEVQTLELIVAVLVILEDVGGDVAEGNDVIIQVWAVEIRHC